MDSFTAEPKSSLTLEALKGFEEVLFQYNLDST